VFIGVNLGRPSKNAYMQNRNLKLSQRAKSIDYCMWKLKLIAYQYSINIL